MFADNRNHHGGRAPCYAEVAMTDGVRDVRRIRAHRRPLRWFVGGCLLFVGPMTSACSAPQGCGASKCENNVALLCGGDVYERKPCGSDYCVMMPDGPKCAATPTTDPRCTMTLGWCDGATQLRCDNGYPVRDETCGVPLPACVVSGSGPSDGPFCAASATPNALCAASGPSAHCEANAIVECQSGYVMQTTTCSDSATCTVSPCAGCTPTAACLE